MYLYLLYNAFALNYLSSVISEPILLHVLVRIISRMEI